MRTTGAAGRSAGTEHIIDDGLDGACAAAAFGAATKTAIELLNIPRPIPGRLDGAADIMVAQNVAGTNDHEVGRSISDADHSNRGAPACRHPVRSLIRPRRIVLRRSAGSRGRQQQHSHRCSDAELGLDFNSAATLLGKSLDLAETRPRTLLN